MSKAFAPGESSDDAERVVYKPPVLPPGTPNYITPAGSKKLETLRSRLMNEKATLTDSVEHQQRGKAIDRDVASLTERLNAVQVVDPATQPKDRVTFGANVTVRDSSGNTRTWRIIGVDETDLNKGWISWISPLARALLEKKKGDIVALGDQRLTIQQISYD
jgi:transcription elongation factor GreB